MQLLGFIFSHDHSDGWKNTYIKFPEICCYRVINYWAWRGCHNPKLFISCEWSSKMQALASCWGKKGASERKRQNGFKKRSIECCCRIFLTTSVAEYSKTKMNLNYWSSICCTSFWLISLIANKTYHENKFKKIIWPVNIIWNYYVVLKIQTLLYMCVFAPWTSVKLFYLYHTRNYFLL